MRSFFYKPHSERPRHDGSYSECSKCHHRCRSRNIFWSQADQRRSFLTSQILPVIQSSHSPAVRQLRSNEKTFPPLSGVGMSITTTILNPCAIRQPHTHPRAGEFNVIVEGSITTQYKAEEGTNFVTNELPTYSSTFFPKGSIHGASNPSCNRAVLMTVFDNNDSGLTNSAPNFFAFNDDIVQGVLGGQQGFVRAGVGSDSRWCRIYCTGYDQGCLTTCGITTKWKCSLFVDESCFFDLIER